MQQGPGRLGSNIGGNVLGQRVGIAERRRLGIVLDEEIERIIDRQFGDQIDGDGKLIGLFGKHQPRQPIAMRVLLPVHKVVFRRHLERIGRNRGAAMRGGAQANDLRTERHRTIIGVAGRMMQFGMNGHSALRLSFL